MKKLILMAMLFGCAPVYAATIQIDISEGALEKFCSQQQFNIYKPEHNSEVQSFDCHVFTTNFLINELATGIHSVYEQQVASDVEGHRDLLIETAKNQDQIEVSVGEGSDDGEVVVP